MFGVKFYLSHPKVLFSRIIIYIDDHFFRVPDKFYISCLYRYHIQRKMHWKTPVRYCEKVNWLKLYDRNPLYTKLVDKIEVKKYVASIIGEEYVIPTIATYKTTAEIDWDSLPSKFAIKCNHDSGSCSIFENNQNVDKDRIIAKLDKGLDRNWFYLAREWAYKNVDRRIIVEELLEDPAGDVKDYKFYCFDGVVKALYVVSNRQNKKIKTTSDFYDEHFQQMPVECHFTNSVTPPIAPKSFEQMKGLCSKLSKGIPHVRIDFYDINGKIYFGEFTFYSFGANAPFEPDEYELMFGSWINLPQKG